ncbi:MAG TPA: DEAD/DEAH box helicase family protein [Syntrophomonadaceae bacterium]|nr:DEAD/DEAH box helicase family protein [Syntrophomonadaceae bacterium]
MGAKKNNKNNSIDLNDCLVLNKYFLSLFGKKDFRELAEEMRSADLEGYNEENTSYYYEFIVRKYGKLGLLDRDKLKEYDENIFRYVRHIGEYRGGLTLKYFQYLALLFTEMYLDRYFLDRENFVADLNKFLHEFNSEREGKKISDYTEGSLNKLAFMCATGSGKTLIMHANILQFQHYFKKAQEYNKKLKLNKIILLTPNEGLSHQHIEELKLSGICCQLFEKDTLQEKDAVLVIDINKLEEQGKVKTVSVDSFEQNNLVLVDEGHKGLSGNVWYDYRSRLSEDGFSFEYSATFKQAIKDERKKSNAEALAHQYGKAIIFDYSYKYFYNDGYGKEYRIYNLKDALDKEQQELYLTGCLLSFYQQLKIYLSDRGAFAPFNIEKPLLVFVGNTVNKIVSKKELSDVQMVLAFINGFTSNKEKAVKHIQMLLDDNSGIFDAKGQQLFYGDFSYLQSLFKKDADAVYDDVLKIVFETTATGRLHLVNFKQLDGEIGLRIGSNNEFFGVINVGTGGDRALIKNIEMGKTGIVTDDNHFENQSLFEKINDKNSRINILIGSKKFTEGWNSWRVSTMGLINFAKGEGAQAIQLFGRGVRLKGYKYSLKRSSKLDYPVAVPKYINKIETLTIFGVKADYMAQFKEYLEKEDMDLNDSVKEFKLPVVSRYYEVKDKLKVIKVKDGVDFKKQSRLLLSVPSDGFMQNLIKNKIRVDYNATVQSITSTNGENFEHQKNEAVLEPQHIAFLDIDKLYAELLQYKNLKTYYNICIDKSLLLEILELKGWYTLFVPRQLMEIDSFDKINRINDICGMLLKKYLDRFFKYHKTQFEDQYLEYQDLKANDKNFIDEYDITLFNKDRFDEFAELFEGIKVALEKNGGLDNYEGKHLNFRYFDFYNHLYTPLISIDHGIRIEVSPVSLNRDEKLFIDKLKAYCDDNPSFFTENRLYLLRNKSKVGIGFFEAGNFYPDFIMWIARDDKQYITFIDPKGIMMLEKNINNPKILFYKTIKELEAQLQPSYSKEQIILNSFILSGTPAADAAAFYGVKITEFESRNVLFLEDDDCIEKMVYRILQGI